MAITTISKVDTQSAGTGGGVNVKALSVMWTGDAAYPYGGSDITDALRTAAQDFGLEPIACVPADCGAYLPVITETPAILPSAAASWPVADQDTNTLTYKVNGGAEQTLTLAGAHTTRAHLAASINAGISGVFAYDDGSQVQIMTDRTGEDAAFEITGGTANAAYLFSTTAVAGTDDKLLKVLAIGTGADAGAGTPTGTDLSATEFNATFLCK